MSFISQVNSWLSEARSRPVDLVMALCVFSAAAAGGALRNVSSTSLAILLILSLLYCRRWPALWRKLARIEQIMLAGLLLYFLSGLLSYINVSDEYEFVKHMGRYLRFLLAIPMYLLVSQSKINLFNFLLAGAVVSGPLYLVLAFESLERLPGIPASWHYHWITFGDAIMLSAVFMMTVLVMKRLPVAITVIVVASTFCALYAAILSQARGGWMALPFCLALVVYLGWRFKGFNLKMIFIGLFVLILATSLSPVSSVISDRMSQAVDDVGLFVSGENNDTSVGGRLAMWHIALNVWLEHPVIGTGLGDFDEELIAAQQQGIYQDIDVHTSTHNIFLQSLVNTGVVGLVVICFALFILPFRLFYKEFEINVSAEAAAGMVMITAFAVFGLSESWILRAPVLSIYLVYLMTLASTVSRMSHNVSDAA